MVNNSLLALAVLVLATIFGVGVYIGVQVAGGGVAGPAESTPTPGGAATPGPTAPTATAAPGATATPAPGAEPTPTGTPIPDEPIPASAFNESTISALVVDYLNENRSEQGLDPFSTDGNTAETVYAMAQNHSESMAQAGTLAHTINGTTSEDRYDYYGITSRCSFDTTETPSDEELEAIAMTVAGQSYTEDGQQRFNEDDDAVARALADAMLEDDDYRERLLQENAGIVGLGVAITDDGEVYATANTCA
jgi:uncharacterized protein YkwD